MDTICLDFQVLPDDPVAEMQTKIANGLEVSGADLVRMIEHTMAASLPPAARHIIETVHIPPATIRGCPSKFGPVLDFALADLHAEYPALLAKYQAEAVKTERNAAKKGDILPRAEPFPSDLVYQEFKNRPDSMFRHMSASALRNLHSKWKNGHFHPADNHPEFDDVHDQIDELFPAPRGS